MVARTIYGQLLLQRQDGHPPTLSGESIDTQNCDMQFFLEKNIKWIRQCKESR